LLPESKQIVPHGTGLSVKNKRFPAKMTGFEIDNLRLQTDNDQSSQICNHQSQMTRWVCCYVVARVPTKVPTFLPQTSVFEPEKRD
jgi:hypothetical protein